MDGTKICGEISFLVDASSSEKYTWPEHGFQLVVPEGALPPGITASVAIRTIVAGPFEFPEGSELIGAIYWVHCSHEFQGNVTVHLQHCALIENEEECSNFKFAIGKCQQPQPPYRFRIVDGSFTPHSQFAILSVSKFSLLAPIWHVPTEERSLHYLLKQRYLAQVQYKCVTSTICWIVVIITQDISSLLEVSDAKLFSFLHQSLVCA